MLLPLHFELIRSNSTPPWPHLDSTTQLVCLLEAVMGHVEKGILRAKFKPISGVLTALLKANLDHEMTGAYIFIIRLGPLAFSFHPYPIRSLTRCYHSQIHARSSLRPRPGGVPREAAPGAGGGERRVERARDAQDLLSTAQLFPREVRAGAASKHKHMGLGGLSLYQPHTPVRNKNLSTPFPQTARHDRRPKVRKAAMAATVELLRLHAGKRVWALGLQVADFSNNVLAACTASDCLPTLHLLGFLQEVRFVDGYVVCPSIST